MHVIRSAYGYTDTQIIEHIRLYGQPWINEAIELINEDKKREMELEVDSRRWLIQVLPLARTPQTKSGASAVMRYSKRLMKALEEMTPWAKEEKAKRIKARLKSQPESKVYKIE